MHAHTLVSLMLKEATFRLPPRGRRHLPAEGAQAVLAETIAEAIIQN